MKLRSQSLIIKFSSLSEAATTVSQLSPLSEAASAVSQTFSHQWSCDHISKKFPLSVKRKPQSLRCVPSLWDQSLRIFPSQGVCDQSVRSFPSQGICDQSLRSFPSQGICAHSLSDVSPASDAYWNSSKVRLTILVSAVSEAATIVSEKFSLLVMLRPVAQNFPVSEAATTASEKFPLLVMLRPQSLRHSLCQRSCDHSLSEVLPVSEAAASHWEIPPVIDAPPTACEKFPLSVKLRP